MLRRDLTVVRRLAQQLTQQLTTGATAAEVSAVLQTLQRCGPLFQLRVTCLSYCHTLASHHRGEDTVLFPAVRRAAPHLSAAVDRLEADHAIVADLLDRIGGLADNVTDRQTRVQLAAVLDELATHLHAHLDFEETTLQPVLDSWTSSTDRMPTEIRDTLIRPHSTGRLRVPARRWGG